MALEHDREMKQAEIQRQDEIQAMSDQMTQLEIVKKQLIEASRHDRKAVEENAWRMIDDMTDQNKQLLAVDIERGMVAKADLTLALKSLRDKNVQKDSCLRTLEEKRVNFEDNKV